MIRENAWDMVAMAADKESTDELRGFWNESNNTLGAVPAELRAGVSARAQARLKRNESNRREIVFTWPRWVFEAAAL